MAENNEIDENRLGPLLNMHNGQTIPQLGFGTFQITESKVADAVQLALELGYRHVDTASIYKNEQGLGQGIRNSQLSREKLFVTSKIWSHEQGYDNTLKACQQSLDRLGLEYLDLYIIHWPSPNSAQSLETWKALEELYSQKKVRNIGLSNFKEHHMQPILENCKVKPMINQIELHPQFPQEDLQAFCRKHSIIIESWAPLARGKLFSQQPIPKLMEQHGKTAAQIILRWHFQQGLVLLPKSETPARIKENSEIFDFSLSENEMQDMAELKGERIWSDPDSFEFIR